MIFAGELASVLPLRPLTEPEMQDIEIRGCYIGDLLSNVMAQAQPGDLWLTVMTNPNIVAVAQLLGLAGIVILEGHQPMQGAVDRARNEGIMIFSSDDSAYTLAGKLKALNI